MIPLTLTLGAFHVLHLDTTHDWLFNQSLIEEIQHSIYSEYLYPRTEFQRYYVFGATTTAGYPFC